MDFAAAYRPILESRLAESSPLAIDAEFQFEESILERELAVGLRIGDRESLPGGPLVSDFPLTIGGGAMQDFETRPAMDPRWIVQNLGGAVFVQRDSDRMILSSIRADVSTALQPVPATQLDDSQLVLFQNIPNPVIQNTKITFVMLEVQNATLQVINAHWQVVRALTAGLRNSGYHELNWDGRDYNGRRVSSGTYIVRLAATQGVRSRKISLSR